MKILAVAGIKRVVYMLPAVDEHAPVLAEEAGIECVELKMGCEVCANRIGHHLDIFNWGCENGYPASFFNRECPSFKFDETVTVGWKQKEDHDDMPICCLAVASEYLDDDGCPYDDPRSSIFGCGVCGRAWGRNKDLVEEWYNTGLMGEGEPPPEEITWWGEIED